MRNFVTLEESKQFDIPTNVFWIILLSAIGLGIILLFLSGFTRVKKDKAAIIERLGEYKGTYKEGIHWFPPIVYRRMGYYIISENTRIISINRKENALLTYQIDDVKKFHYSGHNLDEIVKNIINGSDDNKTKQLKESLNAVGVRFISYEIKSVRDTNK